MIKNSHITGKFHDEELLLTAIKRIKGNKAEIVDLYGPGADHHILKELAPESRLPYLSVLVGLFTILAAFAFIYYVTVIDYPLIFGGKPVFSFPPMVVVLFLVTILVTGAATTLAFLVRTRLFPGKSTSHNYPRALDDRYYLVVKTSNDHLHIKKILDEAGAEEIIEN